MHSTRALIPALLLGSLGLAACSDSTSTGTRPQGQVAMSTASQRQAQPSPSRASYAVTSSTPGTYTDGTNTLVLTKVQLVVREIELEQSSAPCSNVNASVGVTADAGSSGGSGEIESETDVETEGCADLKLGPVLLDVPVTTAGAQQTLAVSLPAGTYNEFKFQIRKPDDSSDQAFLTQHADFAGTSIRVEGTWNNVPFVYKSGLKAKQEIELAQPVTVAENQQTSLTVFIDVSNWFTNGGTLLDPSTGNAAQPNESVIENNIRASFHAFEDENHDGEDDHGSHS
jgi:hypothetical protein